MHVVLVNPEIPQNTGNIGRTCVAVGATLWLVRPLGFRLDEHRLQRAGLDYWSQLEWQTVDSWEELRHALEPRRFWYFSRHADRDFTTTSYTQDDVLVFGCETLGLPSTILAAASADQKVRIPMRAMARSLNLATAVGIVCYEVVRQTGMD